MYRVRCKWASQVIVKSESLVFVNPLYRVGTQSVRLHEQCDQKLKRPALQLVRAPPKIRRLPSDAGQYGGRRAFFAWRVSGVFDESSDSCRRSGQPVERRDDSA